MKQYQIDRIKSLMDAKGITNQELASICGISAMTIGRLLTKTDYNPTTDTVEKIAEALGVHEQYIYETDAEAESKSKMSIRGFIEYDGIVSNIKTFEQLKKVYESILYDKNISKLVKEIKAEEEENKKSQCKTLNISDIDLFKYETIDTKLICAHSFRSNDDIVDDKNNDLGNMASGYGFNMFNEHFHNSECAYICGLFSMNTPKCIEIQRELQASDNGYSAKKDIRNGYEKRAKECVRTDWTTFNVEWMKLCVWAKCKGNKDFQKMLLGVSKNAIIVENSTYHKKPKEGEDKPAFWGARNFELEKKRAIIERSIIVNNPKSTKKDLEERINKARNSIHNFGLWEGTNCMGKILTLCKFHLHNHTELPIDYDLLRSKQIYLFGKLLTFEDDVYKHQPKKVTKQTIV